MKSSSISINIYAFYNTILNSYCDELYIIFMKYKTMKKKVFKI